MESIKHNAELKKRFHKGDYAPSFNSTNYIIVSCETKTFRCVPYDFLSGNLLSNKPDLYIDIEYFEGFISNPAAGMRIRYLVGKDLGKYKGQYKIYNMSRGLIDNETLQNILNIRL